MLRRSLARPAAIAAGIVLALSTSALAYQFFLSKELEATLAQQVGKQVKVVDKLVRVWAEQGAEGFLRFDTDLFRCAIPNSETEGIAYLRELLERQASAAGKVPDATPPLIAISGTVQRSALWGKPRDEAKQAGVEEDELVIVADKVEKPRERFHEEGY